MNETNSSKSDIAILLKETADSRIRMFICVGFCNAKTKATPTILMQP